MLLSTKAGKLIYFINSALKKSGNLRKKMDFFCMLILFRYSNHVIEFYISTINLTS